MYNVHGDLMKDFSELLLVSDFDRTLTDRNSRIPQANLDAIADFEAKGGLFTLATGRSIPMFEAQAALVPSNAPLILYNGAAVYDGRTLSQRVLLPDGPGLLRYLVENFPDLRVEVQGEQYHHLLGEDAMRDQFYRSNRAPSIHFTLREPPANIMKIAVYGTFYDDTVRQFFSGSTEELARLDEARARISRDWPDVVVDRSAPRIIDIQHRSVSKGAAARALASRLGRRLVCVGDASNDLSMLREGDLSFVPADCEEAVAKLGFTQVCPCDEGAIAGVVRALAAL